MSRLFALLVIVATLLLAACGGATQGTLVQAVDIAPLTRQFALPDQPTNLSAMPAINPRLRENAPQSVTNAAQGGSGARAADSWRTLLDDDFSDPEHSGWSLGQVEAGGARIEDGKLVVSAGESWMISVYHKEITNLSDGYITASFSLEGEGSAGVVARVGKDAGGSRLYECGIYSDGDFACYKKVQGEWNILANGTLEGVDPGAEIQFDLQAVGAEITLSIDGAQVTSFNDEDLAAGYWGLYTDSNAGTTTATFSHVQIGEYGAAPTATPTPRPAKPTRTPTRLPASPTATPTEVTMPDDNSFNTLLDDDFEDGNPGSWRTGKTSHSEVAVRDGALVLSADKFGLMLISYPDAATDLADGKISTTVRIDGGAGRAGVFARFQRADSGEWSMYYCGIDSSAGWACGLDLRDETTPFVTGDISDVHSAEDNDLTLSAVGGKLAFQLNDGEPVSFGDASLSSGVWGVWAMAITPVSASFDHVTIASLDRANATPTEPNGVLDVPSGVQIPSGRLGLPSLLPPGEIGQYRGLVAQPYGAARSTAQGALTDVLNAIANTSAASSYSFDLETSDPIQGSVLSAGQYVAPDKVHVQTSDDQNGRREAIIWQSENFVKDNHDHYQPRSQADLNADDAPAGNILGDFAANPNVLAWLDEYAGAISDLQDQGNVRLNGAVTRHYTFILDGKQRFGLDGAAQPFGSGEIYVDLSTKHVYALNYDIDYLKYLDLAFADPSAPPTATPTPGTPETEFHLVYNLRLTDFDAAATFERPNVTVASATATAGAQPSNTRRVTNTRRPTSTPTPQPTSTRVSAIPADVDTMIGDAISAMYYDVDTYHYDMQVGQDRIESDGAHVNAHLSMVADVQNPDRSTIEWQIEAASNGEDNIARVSVVRIGDDVYYKNNQTEGRWQQDTVENVGIEYLATVLDPRPVMADATLLADEDHDGTTAHHIAFTLDMQKMAGEDADLSNMNASGSGELWIAADGGQLLEMRFQYLLEDLQDGTRLEYTHDGVYSDFGEPLDILPPANPD